MGKNHASQYANFGSLPFSENEGVQCIMDTLILLCRGEMEF